LVALATYVVIPAEGPGSTVSHDQVSRLDLRGQGALPGGCRAKPGMTM